MTDRTVMLVVGARITGLQSQMRLGAQAVKDFSNKSIAYIEKNGAAIDSLANSVGVVGAGLVGLAATAVTRFAQFDKAMSAVAATGDDARGSLDALRQAAIDAGADTAFSAAEAAGAIEELAKAGVSSADILGGGLTGALALAAAGEIDVAQAAETAASAMTQFNLAGTDVGHIADLLAAGAGKAQGGVLDMGQALNQTGLIAGQVGLSIEETTGALSAMASAGLIGSDAGTSLKTALVALSSPSEVARKEMEKYGISLYDANGNTLSLAEVAGQLESAFAGQSAETRNAALATIFGTDALRTANVLYSEGADGIREWTAAVDDQGFAAEQAAARTDNLLGDLERLGGSLDTVFIQGGSGANDALRGIVQGAEDVVDAIGRIPGPVLSLTTLIAGGGGLALLGAAGLGKLAVATSDTVGTMRDLGVITDDTSGKITRGMGRATKAIGVGAAALGVFAVAAQVAGTGMDDLAGAARIAGQFEGLAQGSEKATENLERMFTVAGSGGANLSGLDSALRALDQNGFVQFLDSAGSLFGVFDSEASLAQGAVDEFDAALAAAVSSGNAEDAAAAIEYYKQAAEDAGVETETAMGWLTQYNEAADATEAAQEGLTEATREATGATEDNSEAIEKNLQLAREAAGAVLSEREAQRALEAAFDDATAAIEENGRTLDVTTEKGRANQSALDSVADGAWDVAESMYAAGASSKDIAARMGEAREGFIRTATAAGLGEKAANRLADQLGLVPDDVETILKARDNATGTIDHVKGELNGLQDKTITITTIRQVLGTDGGGPSQYVMKKAGGGSVVGPGTATSDSIPAMLSNGEHVLTASDVAKMGGQAGVYAFRSALQNGMVQFARGGEVGGAQRGLDRAWDGLRSARAAARRARDAVREAEAAERRARRTETEADDRAAERQAREAQRALDRAEKRVQEAESRVDDATARRDRLREERVDVATQLRRGELRDSVTGGLSGALGVTDQLRDLANSGDVSGWRQDRLRDVAGSAEKALSSLYKQAERIDAKIASAVERFEMLKQIQDQVQSSLVGGFGLDQVQGAIDPWTGQEGAVSGPALVAAAEQYKGKVQKFSGLLKRLQEAGAGGAILQEVASYGVEQGIPIAEALLSLPKGQLKGLAQTYSDIERFAGYAGASVARAVGGAQGGLWEAEQAVKAAEAQADAIDKRIGNWAKILGNELARALGIKPRADGGPVTAGSAYLVNENTPRSEIFVPPQSGYILNQQQAMTAMGGRPGTTINVTNVYPQAEPTSKTVNRGLQYAAALDR